MKELDYKMIFKTLVVLLLCGGVLYFLYFIASLTIPRLLPGPDVAIYWNSQGEQLTKVIRTPIWADYVPVFFFLIPCGITFYFIGRIVFIIITRLISGYLKVPEVLAEVDARLQEVNKATASGDWYDDSDIYRLDMAIAKAEMKKSGSTLSLYTGSFHINKIDMILMILGFCVAMGGMAVVESSIGMLLLILPLLSLLLFWWLV